VNKRSYSCIIWKQLIVVKLVLDEILRHRIVFDSFLGHKRPLDWSIQFWLLPFFCELIATWGWRVIAHKFNIVDMPDNRVKTHKTPVACLGRIGVIEGLRGQLIRKLTLRPSLKLNSSIRQILNDIFNVGQLNRVGRGY
jgi:hypothetical protein